MNELEFKRSFLEMMQNRDNPFHPLVWINGDPEFGNNIYIGGFSEVNAKGARVVIGDNCDISSFVAINVADSHLMTLGLAAENTCRDIIIENNVFIGTHSAVLGGAHIGHHSAVAAGTIVRACTVPPYSLVIGNPCIVREGYYRNRIDPAGKVK